jgi:FkbM family methyltransferase
MLAIDRPTVTYNLAKLVSQRTRYLDKHLHTLRTLVRPGDVCVDVGAAAGVYTQALSYLVGSRGLVHSVEPLAFGHPFWTRVLGARQRPNVRHHTMALGPEPGRMAMRVPFNSVGAATSRSYLDWKSNGHGSNEEFDYHADVLVDVQTLDGLAESVGLKRLDFLKIDVEGGELHVLTGGENTIERFKPVMFVEIEERHTARYEYEPDDIVEWLDNRGYNAYTWQNGWRQVDRVCTHTNNYVFRPRRESER